MKPFVCYALVAPLLLLFLTLAGVMGESSAESPEQKYFTVAAVKNGKSFTLADGRVVRLASLQAPNVEEDEPMGEASRQALASWVLGKEIRLVANFTGSGRVERGTTGDKLTKDRHNRIVAQAYTKDGAWVQGEMLTSGMAMVYVFPDSGEIVSKMLFLEKEARSGRRGIWKNPYYSPISSDKAASRLNHYTLVEGTPLAVEEKKSGTFINFGRDYKTDFTLFIARTDMRRFKSMPPGQWIGKKLRVRGWVYARGGPMLDLTHPAQVEWLP